MMIDNISDMRGSVKPYRRQVGSIALAGIAGYIF